MTNPRSFKPTSNLKMITLDIDGVSLIDVGYEFPIAMTIPGDMPNFSIQQGNRTNGVTTTYTFSSGIEIPVMIGDRLKLKFPLEIGLPSQAE